MKILVTGANGYIGTGVVRELCRTDYEIIRSDICSEDPYNDYESTICRYVDGNIFEINDPYFYFDKPDVLLHLAWRDGFKHDSDRHLHDLYDHVNFIEKMMIGGIKRVCVMGSVHEIGFYEGSVDESTPTRPESYYGIAKNSLCETVRLMAKKYDVIYQWIRGFYIVGNVENGCSVFSKIYEAEKRGIKSFPFTDGLNQFDFIEYTDFCGQVCAVVMQDKINGIINCCSGYPQRISERVEQFISENKFNIKLNYGAFPERPYDSKAIWGNDKKIRMIMGKV